MTGTETFTPRVVLDAQQKQHEALQRLAAKHRKLDELWPLFSDSEVESAAFMKLDMAINTAFEEVSGPYMADLQKIIDSWNPLTGNWFDTV